MKGKQKLLRVHQWLKEHCSFLLCFASKVFACIANIRKRVLTRRAVSSSPKLISVGSVLIGGAGKTPVILFLMKALQHFRIGYVSRGYGRVSRKDIITKADSVCCDRVGDEAVLIHSHFPDVLLGISRSKKRMVQQLQHESLDVLFLDDGLQRYDIKPHVEIGCIPDYLLFEKEELFPLGMLREPMQRLKDVDFLFVLRENDVRPLEELSQAVEAFLPNRSSIVQQKMVGWITPEGARILLSPEPVVFCSGIARPERCVELLKREGFTVLDTYFVGDHESLLEERCQKWAHSWKTKGVRVVSTEKDWARHAPWQGECPVHSFFLVEIFPLTSENSIEKFLINIMK